MRLKIVFPVAILAILVPLLIMGSIDYPQKAMLVPWIVCIPVTALLVAEVWKEISAKEKTSRNSEKNEGEAAKAKGASRRYAFGIAWFIALLPMIYLLGYLAAIPLFTFLYLKLHGEGWFLSIGLAALLAIIVYFGFVIGLKVPFYQGLVFSYVSG